MSSETGRREEEEQMRGNRRRRVMMQGEPVYVDLPVYTFRWHHENRSRLCRPEQLCVSAQEKGCWSIVQQ